MNRYNRLGQSSDTSRRDFLRMSLATAVVTTAGTSASSAQGLAGKSTLRFFPGFESIRISTAEATINGVKGGSGPPLLLLHGFPQTHIEWRIIAPKLAEHFTVVATDLRGCGNSSKPPDGRDHGAYSKRSVAKDQVEVMRQLGFEKFLIIGHDRGGRVAHRLALDFPNSVSKMFLLDIVPTYKLFNPVTKGLATAYFHFFMFLQPAPFPETLISNSLEYYLRDRSFRGMIPHFISEDAFAEYLRCMRDPATLHAMIEDYRAAASIDLEHDERIRSSNVQFSYCGAEKELWSLFMMCSLPGENVPLMSRAALFRQGIGFRRNFPTSFTTKPCISFDPLSEPRLVRRFDRELHNVGAARRICPGRA